MFRVVPMLNPDGVINGNYRCSLSGGQFPHVPPHLSSPPIPSSPGHDLNRRWLKTDPVLHPEIVAFKVSPRFSRCHISSDVSSLFSFFVHITPWLTFSPRSQNLLDVTARERPLMMFCDLHGHSNKKNMFVYGCAAEYWRQQVISLYMGADASFTLGQDGEAPVQLSESVFPWLLSCHCDFFHFNKCSYRQALRLLHSLFKFTVSCPHAV